MIAKDGIALRALEREDLSSLRDWRNIPDFRKNFREFRELNIDDQLSWFESLQSKKGTDFMFSIIDEDTGELLGACGLLYTNWIARYADVSFYIGKDKAYIDSKGIAKAAANILINYAFDILNLNKIWMELYSFDKKKIEFFQKFSFKVDGVLRQNTFHQGKYEDSLILSLLRCDYEKRG